MTASKRNSETYKKPDSDLSPLHYSAPGFASRAVIRLCRRARRPRGSRALPPSRPSTYLSISRLTLSLSGLGSQRLGSTSPAGGGPGRDHRISAGRLPAPPAPLAPTSAAPRENTLPAGPGPRIPARWPSWKSGFNYHVADKLIKHVFGYRHRSQGLPGSPGGPV